MPLSLRACVRTEYSTPMGYTSNDCFDNTNGLFTYCDSWTLREDFIFDAVLYTMKSLTVFTRYSKKQTRCGGYTCVCFKFPGSMSLHKN